ncbi:MAG: alcohol dehydrogenase catalytic domain-containing protein [Clostridia bacterium]|nr:alcohol dehydrogenase catalytic domain-containing protein [Clostridia bacterium]
MKAMVLTGKAQAEYREVPTPECPVDGLLVKIEAVGLCGSDVRTFTYGHSKVKYPAIIGHETAGTIVEAGPENKGGWKVGDNVIINPAIICGTCYYCTHNLSALCENMHVYGNDIPGGYAQYMAVPGVGVEHGQILRIPEGIAFDEIIIVELLASVIASQENLRISLGETVVIIGTGPIGCLHAQIAKLRGATKIIMADLNRERLDMVHQFGGTHFVDSSKEDLVKIVREVTGGRGADAVIVAAPSTQPHQPGLEMLRKEGRLCVFGGLNKENPWSNLDANLIHYNRLEIRGAYSYSFANFQQGLELVTAGKIDKDIVTHRLPLKDMVEGVHLVQQGKAIKVVLKPWEE